MCSKGAYTFAPAHKNPYFPNLYTFWTRNVIFFFYCTLVMVNYQKKHFVCYIQPHKECYQAKSMTNKGTLLQNCKEIGFRFFPKLENSWFPLTNSKGLQQEKSTKFWWIFPYFRIRFLIFSYFENSFILYL